MPYLIDTDLVIDHLANVTEANQLLEHLAPEGIAISMITYMEAFALSATQTDNRVHHLTTHLFINVSPLDFMVEF